MNNALEKSGAQTIADMPTVVTEAQAVEASMSADLGVDVAQVVARTQAGRFLTQQGGGYIVARAAMTFGFLEAAMQAIAKDIALEKNRPMDRARAGDTLSKLANSAKGILDTERQAMEIVALTGKKERQSGRAPQGTILGMTINTEKVEITEAPKPA